MRGQHQDSEYRGVARRLPWRVRLPILVIVFLGGVGVGAAMRSAESSRELLASFAGHQPSRYVQTSRELDLAIARDPMVFFRLRDRAHEIYYTRHGRFVLDSRGVLIAPDGAVVEPDIIVPDGTMRIYIDLDGTVTTFDGTTFEGTVVGQITLTRFDNPAGLESLGSGRFRETAESGLPQDVTPAQSGNGALNQYCLEVRDGEVIR